MSTNLQTVPARAATVAVYDRAKDVAVFLREIGDAIYRSRMFGCETPSQGQVLALECAARRLPPLALAERYHLIKGKLSMKSEAMLGDFLALPGCSHLIIERSADRAAIELTANGQSQTFSLTWKEAAKEPFVYCGREDDCVTALAEGGTKAKALTLKPKYATPRARMQMLWARVVSDGVRAMAPQIVAGHYTPEEVSDMSGIETGPVESDSAPWEPPAPEPAADDPEQVEIDRLRAQAEAGMAEARKVEERLLTDTTDAQGLRSQPAAEPAATVAPPPGKATPYQVAEARKLVEALAVSREKLAAMLAKVNAAKVSDLSAADCESLLAVLRKERDRREAAASAKN